MRFTRGPEPRRLIGGFHHLRHVFTHPHLWVGFWLQQRAQRCERPRPSDTAVAGGAGDASGAGDAGAAPARLALSGPLASAGPLPPPGSCPRRDDGGTDCDVCCVPERVRYIVYSECTAVMTSAPFLYCENDNLMRSHSFYT